MERQRLKIISFLENPEKKTKNYVNTPKQIQICGQQGAQRNKLNQNFDSTYVGINNWNLCYLLLHFLFKNKDLRATYPTQAKDWISQVISEKIQLFGRKDQILRDSSTIQDIN